MSNPEQYSIGTFSRKDGNPFPALVCGETVCPLATLPGLSASVREYPTTLALFEHWDAVLPQLNAAVSGLDAGSGAEGISLSELRTEVPVMPRQLLCSGANYYKHVVEIIMDAPEMGGHEEKGEELRAIAEKMMDHRRDHGQPFCFQKPVSSITGPYDEILVPPDSTKPDWELEMAVVIGRYAHRVPRDKALDYIAGYTIANDISSRDHLRRADIPAMGMDWLASKGKPGYCPLGPVIVPAQFIADPQDLWIELKLNGDVMQSESTADMLFDVARIIEFMSTYVALLPGDVICTGSPSGNGTHFNRFLTDGDVVEGTITGLGMQRNNCVAENVGADAVMHRPFAPLK